MAQYLRRWAGSLAQLVFGLVLVCRAMGRQGSKQLKVQKSKSDHDKFRIPLITVQNVKEHVAADYTMCGYKVTAAQLKALEAHRFKKLSKKDQMKAKLKEKMQQQKDGKDKKLGRKGADPNDNELPFVVFKLKKMCLIKCVKCLEKLQGSENLSDKRKAEVQNGQLANQVVISMQKGVTWGILDEVKKMEKAKRPPDPERAKEEVPEPRAPLLFGHYTSKAEKARVQQEAQKELWRPKEPMAKLRKNQWQRANKKLRKNSRKNKEDFNKQRADVKQVSALDPKAGTEKRAVKAALDARGRRRAAVQKLRQMSLDANPHQD